MKIQFKEKAFTTFLIIVGFIPFVFSQDIMTLKNGDEIKIKVAEVLPDLIKYKKWDNQDGPLYSEYKTNVFMIKYQNGTKDVFNQKQATPTEITPVSNEEIKKNEAVKIVENYFNSIFTSKQNIISLVSFKKTNGILKNVFGQSVYDIDFDLTIQFLADGYKKGNGFEGYWGNFNIYTEKPSLYSSGEQFLYDLKFFPRGTATVLGGTATMEGTDNGYKLKTYKIRTTKDLGVLAIQNRNNSNSLQSQLNTVKTPLNQAKSVEPVDYKSYNGYLSVDSMNMLIKITDINILDELNNKAELEAKILGIFSNMKRLVQKDGIANKTVTDVLNLVISANFSYRNYSTSKYLSYFADCILELKMLNHKRSSVLYNKTYKLSNYSFLAKGFQSSIEANKNLIENSFDQALSQFIIGNFPLVGEIVEVTEKNKKQTEAKMVKINLGRNNGLYTGYSFLITDFNSTESKADIIVEEAYEDYSLCKVEQNERKILDNLILGTKLKIRTIYKP